MAAYPHIKEWFANVLTKYGKHCGLVYRVILALQGMKAGQSSCISGIVYSDTCLTRHALFTVILALKGMKAGQFSCIDYSDTWLAGHERWTILLYSRHCLPCLGMKAGQSSCIAGIVYSDTCLAWHVGWTILLARELNNPLVFQALFTVILALQGMKAGQSSCIPGIVYSDICLA
ncbi:hypothetical protein DPMN_011401 [Dreissena polymorpha]|uniref:Uncharacterized protein n=1 Tax=Dreissena polymorpha TaxID=45954 RepID=A0A9D4S1T6_DREPO|nr:hypothetical protein DPMN_011401 [Dreissena polymorpha]